MALARRRNYKREVRGPLKSVTVVLRLTAWEREALQQEATERGYGPCGLARMLIERVLQDSLFKAILDD